ncbi:MAG: PhzF family phenazine biosynthesis protein [Candidatus Zixiibacteriota bacterium]
MVIITVDSFTDKPFSGNPAAVCVMDSPADESWMQSVAREMNLSETAFLYPVERGYNLRWFTPTTEVDLCGHATLASAHVLWEGGQVARESALSFQTKSGELGASLDGDIIELRFPLTPASQCAGPAGLVDALGVKPAWIGESVFDFLVELDSEETLRRLNPDFLALSKLKARGVIVTARSSQQRYDFVSRYFAPSFGINEDPVTGSTHCALGPYWSEKLGKTSLRAYQASERGGEMRVTVDGIHAKLGGKAVTVMRGELL